jgi:hypothetical protein
MRALFVLSLVGCLALPHAATQGRGARTRPAAERAIAPASGHAIPERPAEAPGGTAFVRRLAGLARGEREAAIVSEVLRGNVPSFLRRLQPVTLRGRVDGKPVGATVWAMPDYLAVGSDTDFVRVPLSFNGAIVIARAFGMALPTRKIVDAVYAQASLRLRPQTMTPGPRMTSPSYFLVHNQRIESQIAGRRPGVLVAGHKKDLVITNRLARQRTPRVAIYGWHRGPGDPIQPLSTVHGAAYADYSHGVRLIAGVMTVNGIERPVIDVLLDAHVAALISLEGTIRLPAGMLPGERPAGGQTR